MKSIIIITLILFSISCGRTELGGNTGLSPNGVVKEWVFINDEFYFQDQGNGFYQSVYVDESGGGYYRVSGFFKIKGSLLILEPMEFHNDCNRPSEIVKIESEVNNEPHLLGLEIKCK
jgi:hypothetical protein